jgi:hypothetical protein
MRKPGGFTFLTYDDGRTVEGESFSCRHCNRVVFVRPRERPEDVGGLCKSCMGLTCAKCTDKMAAGALCVPLEERLKREEARYEALRSYRI